MPPLATMHPQKSHIGIPETHQHLRLVPTQPLRRAVYIHVSDLISAYNIDHVKLEEELERVKTEREAIENKLLMRSNSSGGSGGFRHGSTVHTTGSGGSNSSMGGIPTELEAREPQKRLQPPRGGHNMVVLVGKVKVVVDKHRVDGSRVRLAEVEVGDETGIVSLRARDDQIDVLQSVAAKEGAVVLRNCTLELYQGKHIRLAITKWGKLSKYPDNVASTPPPPSKINRDRNFSFIDLSIVASEMDVFPTASVQSASDVQQQQTQSYNRQHAHTSENVSFPKPSSQQPQQPRGKGRGKPSRGGKQIIMNNPNNTTQPMKYQLVDQGSAVGGGMSYNPHSLPPPQSTLHPSAYGGSAGFLNQPHQLPVSSGVHHSSVPQHYQYSPTRQPTDPVHVTHSPHHHPQQQQQMLYQHQFEMQHRQVQQRYQVDRAGRNQRQQQTPSYPQPPGGRHPVSSFVSGVSRHDPTAGHQFISQQQQKQQYQEQARSSSPTSSPQQYSLAGPDDIPGSPAKMNPKAASFDPAGKYNRKPSR